MTPDKGNEQSLKSLYSRFNHTRKHQTKQDNQTTGTEKRKNASDAPNYIPSVPIRWSIRRTMIFLFVLCFGFFPQEPDAQFFTLPHASPLPFSFLSSCSVSWFIIISSQRSFFLLVGFVCGRLFELRIVGHMEEGEVDRRARGRGTGEEWRMCFPDSAAQRVCVGSGNG